MGRFIMLSRHSVSVIKSASWTTTIDCKKSLEGVSTLNHPLTMPWFLPQSFPQAIHRLVFTFVPAWMLCHRSLSCMHPDLPDFFWWKIHLTNQLISWIMMNHEYQTSIAVLELFQLVWMNNCPTVGIFSRESKNLLTRESRFRSFLTESWLGCTDPSKDISWSPFLNPGCFHEGDWEAQEDAGL